MGDGAAQEAAAAGLAPRGPLAGPAGAGPARELGFERPVLWINDSTYAPLAGATGWPTVYDVTDDWLLTRAAPGRWNANGATMPNCSVGPPTSWCARRRWSRAAAATGRCT